MYKVTYAQMKRAYDAYGHECIFTMIVNVVGGTVCVETSIKSLITSRPVGEIVNGSKGVCV